MTSGDVAVRDLGDGLSDRLSKVPVWFYMAPGHR